MYTRSYTDDDLKSAVGQSHSWRGVLRALGLVATSAGSARSVRRHADRLGLSYAHFTGQRRWTDAQLRAAVGTAHTWLEVTRLLGLSAGGGNMSALHAHCVRLDLSTEHFGPPTPEKTSNLLPERADPSHIRDAAGLFAAAWFTLRGAKVSWPLEPCRYDLVVDLADSCQRIRVKSTPTSSWTANSRPYLIPYETVAGLGHLKLSHYAAFRVAERGDLLSAPSSRGP